MSSLNDDELTALIRHAQDAFSGPSPELEIRVMRAFQSTVIKERRSGGALFRPVFIPWPLAVLAAVLLFLSGFLADRSFHQNFADQPKSILTFRDFQPVSQITPHVIRSFYDGQ